MLQPATDPQVHDIIGSHELREITELLVRHHGLHEGLYDLVLEFQITVGAVGPEPSLFMPGAIFGVRKIGIVKTDKPGISTVDAAEVNPRSVAKKVAAKKTTSK